MIRFILLNLTFTFVLKWEASSWTTDFITVFAEFFCGSFFLYISLLLSLLLSSIIICMYYYYLGSCHVHWLIGVGEVRRENSGGLINSQCL